MMHAVFAVFAVIVPLLLNVLATRAVVRDGLSERSQKIFQLGLVWLLPLAGALLVLAVHRSPEAASRKYREPPEPGDDMGLSGRGAKNLSEALDGD
jgi:hypothetical protein